MEAISDFEKSVLWAKQLLETDWLILDTETTGLGPEAQICQIATLSKSNPEGWQTLVRPTVPISREATAIHGIEQAEVQDAPTFDLVFPDLLKTCGRREITIFNAEFDLRLIQQSLVAHGIYIAFPVTDFRQTKNFVNGAIVHCAMLHYSAWCGDWNEYYGSYRWQKLPGGDHSALGDCKAALKVIEKMASSQLKPRVPR